MMHLRKVFGVGGIQQQHQCVLHWLPYILPPDHYGTLMNPFGAENIRATGVDTARGLAK